MAEGELWLLYALTGDQVERFASGLVPYPHLLTRGARTTAGWYCMKS